MSSDKHRSIAIAQGGVPNLIGNIYTKDAIVKMYECVSETIEKGFFGGELLHVANDRSYGTSLDLSKVTHQVTRVDIVDDFLVVDLEFMSTPDGETVRNMVESGNAVIRPTIAGRLDSTTKEITVDNVISFDAIPYHEDFRLHITWKKVK